VKLFVGIRRVEDLVPLLDLGADEFYTGFYVDGSVESRGHYDPRAGLQSWDELSRALDIVHAAGSKLFIAINTLYYGVRELSALGDWTERIVRFGVDGIIVGSVPLLIELGRRRLPSEICLSTLQPAFSGESLGFFKQFGITRIALPEHVGAYEIRDILEDRDIRTETLFWVTNSHFFTESFCVLHHRRRMYLDVIDPEGFQYCLEPAVVSMPGRDSVPPEDLALFDKVPPCTYRRINDAANLYDLHLLGLDYLKIGGREFKPEGRLSAVKLGTWVRDTLNGGRVSREDFVAELNARIKPHFGGEIFHVDMVDR
jgi:collagenase-like PrtC family protease